MTRNEAIELLEQYNKLLMEEGYYDKVSFEMPKVHIDQFLNTKWAKENLPIENKFGRLFNVIDA